MHFKLLINILFLTSCFTQIAHAMDVTNKKILSKKLLKAAQNNETGEDY